MGVIGFSPTFHFLHRTKFIFPAFSKQVKNVQFAKKKSSEGNLLVYWLTYFDINSMLTAAQRGLKYNYIY